MVRFQNSSFCSTKDILSRQGLTELAGRIYQRKKDKQKNVKTRKFKKLICEMTIDKKRLR